MKYLLVILLGLSFTCQAQEDSTVCIKPQTARYFLEADDERWVLRERDTLQTQLILNLTEQSLVRDQIIVTYQNDSSSYAKREVTFLSQIRLLEEDLEDSEGKLRKRTLLELLLIVGIIIASIL